MIISNSNKVSKFTDINIARHFVGYCAEPMKALAQPLTIFGIVGVKLCRIYDDNSGVAFSTFPEFLEVYQEHKLWRVGGAGDFENYADGYCFWDSLDSAVIFKALAESCHLGNGLTVIKKHKEFVDIFYFAADINNFNIKQFFLNNLDIIERFIRYCYIEVSSLLIKGKKHRFIYPEDKTEVKQLVNHNSYAANQEDRMKFNLLIKSKVNKNLGNFTQRELQIINHFSKGLSAKAIARLLNISVKTVDQHLVNAKIKVGAKNVVELCMLAYKLNNLLDLNDTKIQEI